MRLHVAERSIEVKPTFKLKRSISFLENFSPTDEEQVLGENSLTKGLRLGGRTIVFRVEQASGGGRLKATLFSATSLDTLEVEQVLSRVRAFLSVDDDVAEFYQLADADKALQHRLQILRGMHHVRFLTPIEIAVWAVLAQRLPRAQARRAKQALVERFSQSLTVEGHVYWAFPEASEMAVASPAEIEALVKNRMRAPYVHAVIQAFARCDERFLYEAPFDEVESWLRAIHGVGPWSSAFVLFRGLNRADRIPLTEPIQQAARNVYGARFSPGQMRQRFEHYGRWKGYWSLYLRATA
jgi:DNA-3-methyladenine glycosylase II